MMCWFVAAAVVVITVFLLVQWIREEPPGMKDGPDDLELIEEAEAVLRGRGMTWDEAIETTARLAERDMTAREISEAVRRGRYG
jgi:hypothetical protein